MKKIKLCLLYLLLVASSGLCFAEEDLDLHSRDNFASRFLSNYITTFYNTFNNDFPTNEANAVLQTRDGFMWFATYNGLVRFDGKKYTVWNSVSNNGFNSSSIRALFEDNNGTLWIGTDKGLVAYRNGTFTIYDRSRGTPSNIINDIAQSTDGNVYCGTSDGLFSIDNSGNLNIIELDATSRQSVSSITSDSKNNIYLVLSRRGELYAYTSAGKTIRYSSANRITDVISLSDDRIVIGLPGGEVAIVKFNGEEFYDIKSIKTQLVNISSFYEDSNSFVWITSETGIGFIDTNDNYHHVGNPNVSGFYTSIWEDYQNGYWITSSKTGAVKFTVSAFSDLSAMYNLGRSSANAILINNENIYIGTDNGLFVFDKDGKPILPDLTAQVTSRIRMLYSDSAGNIWICTYARNGLIRYSPLTNTYKNWLASDGLISSRVRCAVEIANGVIAVGTSSGVSFIKGDTVISVNEAFETEKSITLPAVMISSFAYSTDGTLYIGTDGNGVYAISKNGTVIYNEENGLSGGNIMRMAVNQKTNGVWVAASSGLCYIENGTARVKEKVPPYAILDLMQYNNDLVILTSSAIIRASVDMLLNDDLPFEHISLNNTSGLTVSISANAWNLITPNGDLYFCSSSGINKYSFESSITPFIPYAGIVKINIDNTEFTDFSQKIILAPNANRLTIELSFLSFGLLDNATLKYMLIGQDKNHHSRAKNDNKDASYTNLKGGNYTFRVWTEDQHGNTGNLIEVVIIKELKFFERPFVWVSIVILSLLTIIAFMLGYIRYKTRKHQEKQREYRTIITQALSAIASTIDAKDAYTSGHSVRVAAYSVEIARRLGMSKDFQENLYYIGLLHDVGKIGIPNTIINKPDKLTDEEYNIMKQHTNIGLEILKGITTIRNLTAGAVEHHEHWNGKGYGSNMVGNDITLEARIITAADTYDAMSSDRSYRKGLSKDIILAEFKKIKGEQLDPQISEIMVDLIEQDYFKHMDITNVIDLNKDV